MASADHDLLEGIERRARGADAEREEWDPINAEVAKYTQPHLTRTGQSDAKAKGRPVNSKLLDGEGTEASNVLGNGMYGGMSPSSNPWFKLTTEDADLREKQDVKEWLAVVEDRIYSFLSRTNYYSAAKSSYREQGLFGCSATVMLEHPEYGAVNHGMTWGSYSITLDYGLNPNGLYRKIMLTTAQMVARFPIVLTHPAFETIRAAYKNDDAVKHEVRHAIERNTDRVPGKRNARNRMYRSVYWIAGKCETPLEIKGMDERPFWAPRWEPTNEDTYSIAPGHYALPALRALQLGSLRKAQSIDYGLTPPIGGPPLLNNVSVSLLPKSITAIPGLNGRDQIGPLWTVDPRWGQVLREDISGPGGLREEVRRYFKADLFMAITNMQGIQPRTVEEIARRNEERLTQLGPVVEANNSEQLKVSIDRAFGIMSRLGLLPPAPQVLVGQELKLQYIGVLSQLQRAIGVGSIERSIGFVGNIAGIYPAILDKYDFDQAVDEYADRLGVPPKLIRSDDVVAKMRSDRAAQEQKAQMAAAAPAAVDGAQAAKLLSETDTGDGISMLQRALQTA